MAQFSMNAYDADVYISDFKGLMQYGDQMQSDLRYSPDCLNVETPGGVLQPSMPIDGVALRLIKEYDLHTAVYADPVESGTLMYVRDKPANYNEKSRVFAGGERKDPVTEVVSENMFPGDMLTIDPTSATGYGNALYNDTYLIATGGYIYRLPVAGDPKETGTYNIETVPFASNEDRPSPTGGAYIFKSDRWSWCTYEYNNEDDGLQYQVIVMTNGVDGVYLYGLPDSTLQTRRTLVNLAKANDMKVPQLFTCVARHGERIWGARGYRIYYSAPFDCMDWQQNNASPADGGGNFDLPTWEKDSEIIALQEFGDALIAFTKTRAWKISGTDPSNIIIQEQIGNGCPYPDTIANMGQYLLFLGDDSLVSYDGYQVKPFMKEATYELLKGISSSPKIKPCGVRVGDKYVLSMSNEFETYLKNTYYSAFRSPATVADMNMIQPTDWATSAEINKSKGYLNFVYDMTDGTIVCNESPQILSLCDLMPYALVYDPGDPTATTPVPAVNRLCRIRFNSWENQRVTDKASRWVSPWITFGRNDIKKGGFDMYITPEIRPGKIIQKQLWMVSNIVSPDGGMPSETTTTETAEADTQVTFHFSIQTEKKTKSKDYTVKRLSSAELAAGKEYKMKKLHFGGSGRRFRLIIEVPEGNVIPWRLIGGIHIVAETDKD